MFHVKHKTFDVAVIGAGHAGVEAALASAEAAEAPHGSLRRQRVGDQAARARRRRRGLGQVDDGELHHSLGDEIERGAPRGRGGRHSSVHAPRGLDPRLDRRRGGRDPGRAREGERR